MRDPSIYIEIKTSNLRLSELMAEIEKLKDEHPDEEIFMDGDLYAVIGRPRK